METKHLNMSLKRKEDEVDEHAEKATCFFVACEPNPATKVKLTEAMRVKGYLDLEATNLCCKCRCIG